MSATLLAGTRYCISFFHIKKDAQLWRQWTLILAFRLQQSIIMTFRFTLALKFTLKWEADWPGVYDFFTDDHFLLNGLANGPPFHLKGVGMVFMAHLMVVGWDYLQWGQLMRTAEGGFHGKNIFPLSPQEVKWKKTCFKLRCVKASTLSCFHLVLQNCWFSTLQPHSKDIGF